MRQTPLVTDTSVNFGRKIRYPLHRSHELYLTNGERGQGYGMNFEGY